MGYTNKLITDFTDTCFQEAFKMYFSELGVTVQQWDKLFCEMNEEPENFAFLRLDEQDNVIGFIQISFISFTSWFFESRMGFVREFWVQKEHRSCSHGAALLNTAEAFFLRRGVYKAILTTDTAEAFYVRRGYRREDGISAKNGDAVYMKRLK